MAVKPEKIKERLKVLFPKANLSQKRIDEISARLAKKTEDDAEDDAVDQVINDANDLMDFAAIAKEDDRVRTLEAKTKAPETTTEEKKEEQPGDDAPAWAKAMMSDLEVLKKEKVTESKQTTVADLFAKSEVLKGLPEAQKQSWMNRVNLESEDLSAEIAGLETEYSELKQSVVDSMGFSGVPSYNSVAGKNISDADVDSALDSM